MNLKNSVLVTFLSCAVSSGGPALVSSRVATARQTPEAAAVAKRIGVIKSIDGNVVTITVPGGPEVAVTVQPTARVLRLVPGEKDVKNATPIQLQELQVGDTIRARGQASDDGKSMAALEVIVITRSAVDAVGDQIRQDWQKRGIAGPVSAVDPVAGTVTISTTGFGGKKTIVVRTTKSTIVHRYSSDSVKPEDAKPSTLQDIGVGDQLRARGNRNADGSELAAEEIFSGTFPNFAGLIKSVDAANSTISLQDLVSKKNVQLKITTDSQLHKIPAEMAQRFAARVKAALPPGVPGAPMNSASTAPATAQAASAGSPSGMGPGGGMGGGARAGGGFDLQRLLDQTPAVALADLHKGDAIAVLATQGTPASGSTVIKLFSGVEPILQAAPSGSQAMMLAPWTLGGAPGGDAGQQ